MSWQRSSSACRRHRRTTGKAVWGHEAYGSSIDVQWRRPSLSQRSPTPGEVIRGPGPEASLCQKSCSTRGACRLGENVTEQKPDWHEAIDFYAEPRLGEVDLGSFARSPAAMSERQLEAVRTFVAASNLWPEQPAGFRSHAEAYFAQMQRVGDGLMDAAVSEVISEELRGSALALRKAMAMALGLPETYFRDLTGRSFWCARVIGYPALTTTMATGTSCGEHSDYGCWTILSQAHGSCKRHASNLLKPYCLRVLCLRLCRMTRLTPSKCATSMAAG